VTGTGADGASRAAVSTADEAACFAVATALCGRTVTGYDATCESAAMWLWAQRKATLPADSHV